MIVYYVTADHGIADDSGLPSLRTRISRVDLGKFFARADAAAHAEKIGHGWYEVRIEEREERLEDQDPAHRTRSFQGLRSG